MGCINFLFFKKIWPLFMTWIANVWVRYLKPMKYKTLGRAPNLFKVPRQWCQVLSCSWQWSLGSLWINNKMEMEGDRLTWALRGGCRGAYNYLRKMQADGHYSKGLIDSTTAWWMSLKKRVLKDTGRKKREQTSMACEKESNGLFCFLRDRIPCVVEYRFL